MRTLLLLFLSLGLVIGCEEAKVNAPKKRSKQDEVIHKPCDIKIPDSLKFHHSYLSVYSQVYHRKEKRQYNLSVTVSLRNVSTTETLIIKGADYYDSDGNLVHHYVDNVVCLGPLQTVDIMIDEPDTRGGTGANFIFTWAVTNNGDEPLFEAVMISTSGQQGLSFVTRGIQLN